MTVKNARKRAFGDKYMSLLSIIQAAERTTSIGLYSASENSPSTEISDRLFASMPRYMNIGLIRRNTKLIAELDKYAIVPELCF